MRFFMDLSMFSYPPTHDLLLLRAAGESPKGLSPSQPPPLWRFCGFPLVEDLVLQPAAYLTFFCFPAP